MRANRQEAQGSAWFNLVPTPVGSGSDGSSSDESSESTMSNATFDNTFREHMGDEARAMDASA